jgi:hypothetical protein
MRAKALIVPYASEGRLAIGDRHFVVSCNVRTLRDGNRLSHEVVRSYPDRAPYDPQPFPTGLWRITGVVWQRDAGFDPRTYGPVKILTDAWRHVNAWELDAEGDYLRETSRIVRDSCYWMHYSVSKTTLGCIRFFSPADAVAAAEIVLEVLRAGEILELES